MVSSEPVVRSDVAHYIEVHDVPLPKAFLQTVSSSFWHKLLNRGGSTNKRWDASFWVNWTARVLSQKHNVQL